MGDSNSIASRSPPLRLKDKCHGICTEIAFLPIGRDFSIAKPDIYGSHQLDKQSEACTVVQNMFASASRQPGYQGAFFGLQEESLAQDGDQTVILGIEWSEIQSHLDFKGTPDHKQMSANVGRIMPANSRAKMYVDVLGNSWDCVTAIGHCVGQL
jgi:hypothetical protein